MICKLRSRINSDFDARRPEDTAYLGDGCAMSFTTHHYSIKDYYIMYMSVKD